MIARRLADRGCAATLLAATLAVGLAGCAKVEEPWTEGRGEEAKQKWETARSADLLHEMRDRAMLTQTDR